MNTVRSRPQPSKRQPEPAWDIAHLFPVQGDWTEDDYFRLVTKRGYELCDGRLEMLPMPTELHQMIASYLFSALKAHATLHQLGLVLFSGLRVRTLPGKVREPDIVFMHHNHSAKRSNQKWDGADLAMEIVSDDDPNRDRVVKRREYAKAGIAEYWIVDPQKDSITILVLKGSSYRILGEYRRGEVAKSNLLTGFEVDVRAALKGE